MIQKKIILLKKVKIIEIDEIISGNEIINNSLKSQIKDNVILSFKVYIQEFYKAIMVK